MAEWSGNATGMNPSPSAKTHLRGFAIRRDVAYDPPQGADRASL